MVIFYGLNHGKSIKLPLIHHLGDVFPCIEEANPSKNERCFFWSRWGHTQPVASFVLKCWGPMDVHNCFAVSVGCGSKFRFDWLEQGQKQTTANNTNNTSSNKNNKSLASKCKVQYHATFFLCMSLVFSSTEMTTKLSSFLFVFQFEAEKLS